MTLKMHPSIQLASGDYFNFLEPHTTPLAINDIAMGLSRICRYTGHLKSADVDLYSVAQHCVLASEYGEGDPFENLMHDRAESVIGDVSSPLKQLLNDYKVIEDRVEAVTARQYGLPHPMSDTCKAIDLRMLATEKRDMMPEDDDADTWKIIKGVEPLPFEIKPWSRAESYHRFLHRFHFLKEGKYPKPIDPFGKPHVDAPPAYIEGYYKFWLDEDNCAANGLRKHLVGSRLPLYEWVVTGDAEALLHCSA